MILPFGGTIGQIIIQLLAIWRSLTYSIEGFTTDASGAFEYSIDHPGYIFLLPHVMLMFSAVLHLIRISGIEGETLTYIEGKLFFISAPSILFNGLWLPIIYGLNTESSVYSV